MSATGRTAEKASRSAKAAEGPQRVFAAELGDWPKVWKTGPSSYRLTAWFRSPRHVNTGVEYFLRVWPAAFALLLLFRWFGWRQSGNWGSDILLALMLGGVCWPLSFLWTWRQRLVMTIKDGGAVWWGPGPKPPGWTRKGWPYRYVLEPGANYECGVLPQHRDSARFGFYCRASDLSILTGTGKHIELRVAEIHDDNQGRRAHTLKTAIDLAIAQSLIDASKARRQGQGRAVALTGGGRHD